MSLQPSRKRKQAGDRGAVPKKTKQTHQLKLKFLPRSMPELKESQVFFNNVTIEAQTPTTQIALINGVAQGTDFNQRIGRKIQHMYIDLKMQIRVNGASTSGDSGFWSVVLDRQPNGALASFGDIYDITTTSTLTGTAPKNTANYQDRFQILATDSWSCNNTDGGDAPYYVHQFIDLKKILKGKDKTANFAGSTGVIGAFNSGAILIMWGCITSTVAQPASVVCCTKYRFMDD